MTAEEANDLRHCRDKIQRQFGIRRFPNHDEQADVVPNYGSKFIWFVANAGVMGDRHPSLGSNDRKPFLVRAGRPKMVTVPLNA